MPVQSTLRSEGFENDAALDAAIKKLETDLKKSRKKDTDGDEMEVSTAFSVFRSALNWAYRKRLLRSRSLMFQMRM